MDIGSILAVVYRGIRRRASETLARCRYLLLERTNPGSRNVALDPLISSPSRLAVVCSLPMPEASTFSSVRKASNDPSFSL